MCVKIIICRYLPLLAKKVIIFYQKACYGTECWTLFVIICLTWKVVNRRLRNICKVAVVFKLKHTHTNKCRENIFQTNDNGDAQQTTRLTWSCSKQALPAWSRPLPWHPLGGWAKYWAPWNTVWALPGEMLRVHWLIPHRLGSQWAASYGCEGWKAKNYIFEIVLQPGAGHGPGSVRQMSGGDLESGCEQRRELHGRRRPCLLSVCVQGRGWNVLLGQLQQRPWSLGLAPWVPRGVGRQQWAPQAVGWSLLLLGSIQKSLPGFPKASINCSNKSLSAGWFYPPEPKHPNPYSIWKQTLIMSLPHLRYLQPRPMPGSALNLSIFTT